MDRRTEKTRAAIVAAYKQLLGNSEATVTVQQIIDLANIGRSTFYSHFSDKSSLPQEIFYELFRHVGTETQTSAAYSRELLGLELSDPINGPSLPERLEQYFVHLLKHLDRERGIYSKLFEHTASDWFYYDFHCCLEDFLCTYILEQYVPLPRTMPKDLYIEYLTDAFLTMVRWLYMRKQNRTVQQVAWYYVNVILQDIK